MIIFKIGPVYKPIKPVNKNTANKPMADSAVALTKKLRPKTPISYIHGLIGAIFIIMIIPAVISLKISVIPRSM